MMCRALDAGFLIITLHVPPGCTRRVTIIFIAELSINDVRYPRLIASAYQ